MVKEWGTIDSYLLDCVERPLPPEPTHYVVAEVLNTDLSIKRVTVYYNANDTWQGCTRIPKGPESIGMEISEWLIFLNRDPNTLAYKVWVMDIKTNEQILSGRTYLCTRCEL
jgi:hypothetical protein